MGLITNSIGKVWGLGKEHLGKGFELLKKAPETILNVATETREKLATALLRRFPGGEELDKLAADNLRSLQDMVGNKDVLGKEKPFLFSIRKQIAEYLEKRIPELDRMPAGAGSDADFIEREGLLTPLITDIHTEEAVVTGPEISSDGWFVQELSQQINQARGSGLALLKSSHPLSKKALKRAALVNQDSGTRLTDLRYRELPPLSRETLKSEAATEWTPGGQPRFTFKNGEEWRLEGPPEPEVGKSSTPIEVSETDESFAKRIKEVRQKRKNLHAKEISATFRFEDQQYPFGGDPRALFQALKQKPEFEELLKGEDDFNQLAIGIHRDSSGNVSVDVIAVRGEEEAEAAEISPQVEQENAFSNTWWYERIPLDDRMSPSPYRTLFEGTPPGKPSFQSGYSLYRLYEFQREINQLHDSGRDIGLNLEGQALIIQQEEHFFEPNTSSVEISIRINGHDEKFKLFSGTDLIEIVGPSTPLSTSKKEQSQGAAKVRIPLSQYLARIQDMVGKKGADGLQMRRHSATGKEAPAPKKGEKAPAPAPVPDEEELIAAGLS